MRTELNGISGTESRFIKKTLQVVKTFTKHSVTEIIHCRRKHGPIKEILKYILTVQ